jgi:hypothetical protein
MLLPLGESPTKKIIWIHDFFFLMASMLLELFLDMWFFYKYSTNVDTHTHMSTYFYEYTQPTSISIFERLNQLDLEIHRVDHQEYLVVDTFY